ncbi:MAG TPA: hypothetical protein DD713_02290 [Nitrospiraceae bacterium]|nr:hypothetical protein [Nitrospiraceae bacterium]
MKQSKHSPKKLPPNQEGLYSILDPHRAIESGLIDWYDNLIHYSPQVPSALLWGETFTTEECLNFAKEIVETWADFEEQATEGLKKDLFPYLNYPEDAYQKRQIHKFTTFDSKEYLPQISRRIAAYKTLANIKPRMKQILFSRKRFKLYEDIIEILYKERIYTTPGQPEDGLLKTLIKDLEWLSDQYFPDSKTNKPYRSVLAFYLAKQDCFDKLKCVNKKTPADLCSATDCISIEKENCIEEIRHRSQEYKFDIDTSRVLLCSERFTYVNCKKCRSHVRDYCNNSRDKREDDGPLILFLRRPCTRAVSHYNDILERIKKDKNSGKLKAMHISDIKMFKKELEMARQSDSRKSLTAIFNKAQGFYPHLSRKVIQRILS